MVKRSLEKHAGKLRDELVTVRMLEQYFGKLNNKQITEGINTAFKNVRRLIKDAKILFDNKRYVSVVTFGILAIEELGKEDILRDLAIASNDKEVKKLWRNYRKHTKKNLNFILPLFSIGGKGTIDDLKSMYENEGKYTRLINMMKQNSLYSDCLGQGKWSEPSKFIGEKEAKGMMVMLEKVFLPLCARNRKEIEVELWVKHMGKVKDGNDIEKNEAMLRWYAEIKELGLRPRYFRTEDFRRWLNIKPDK